MMWGLSFMHENTGFNDLYLHYLSKWGSPVVETDVLCSSSAMAIRNIEWFGLEGT